MAGLNLRRFPARNAEPMERTGNDMKLRRHPGADEATSVFQASSEKQIDRADDNERGRQSVQVGDTRGHCFDRNVRATRFHSEQ